MQIRAEDLYRDEAIARDEMFDKYLDQSTEIHAVMGDIAKLVEDQGIAVEDIESQAVSARDAAGDGVDNLHQASKYQQAFGWKIFFVLLLIVVIAGGVVAILYLTRHKK